MERPEGDTSREMGQGYALLTVAMTFALTVVLFLLLGRWIDQRLGTAPWLMLVGVVVGVGLGGTWAWLRLRGPGGIK